jgi:hypothetical protein
MLRPSGFIISSSFRRHCSFTSSTTAVAVSVAKLLPRHFQRASLQHCCLPSSSSRSRRRGLFVVAAFVLATTSSSTFGPTTSVVRAYSSFGSSSSMSFITERTGGDGGIITISPKDESKQSALVVISHGLGDTSEGFADVAEVRQRTRTHHKRMSGALTSSTISIFEFFFLLTTSTISFFIILIALGQGNAILQIHSTNRADATRYHEHGHEHAIVVRHRRFG